MTDPNHGNSIITRLRLIIERMHEFGGPGDDGCGSSATLDACRAEAENLLPLADVDDIEVIVLREAAAILNGRGWHDLSDKVEAAGDAFVAEEAVSMTQNEAEAIAYGAINTFITRSAAAIPLTHEGLNTVRNAAQQALESRAPGRWTVDAALPDSDWSRTPAVTVRPAPGTRWRKDGFRPGSMASDAARPRGMGGGPINPDKTGRILRRVVARSDSAPWEQEATELMGLTITRHNAGKHVQLLEGTSILAEWWPGKGTTMRGGKRGPLCATGEDLIAWLRSID